MKKLFNKHYAFKYLRRNLYVWPHFSPHKFGFFLEYFDQVFVE